MEQRARVILAIEASNPSSGGAGVCVARVSADGVDVLGSCALDGGSRASDGVMVAVDAACAEAGVGARDLEAIAVSVGPGGFTALRIATTTAKTLGYALGIGVIAVPTAAVAREAIGAGDRAALIALAGKKDAAHLTLLDEDGTLTEIGVVGAGGIAPGMARTLVGDAHVPGAVADRCAGLGMGRLGIVLTARALAAASRGFGEVGAREVRPIYAREPDAVTQWRARHGG
jgi:tRNA threonylcarbamoyl adenosine modification protein YeaZ